MEPLPTIGAGQHRRQLDQVRFRRLVRAVTQGNVRNLVRHHTSQLRLIISGSN